MFPSLRLETAQIVAVEERIILRLTLLSFLKWVALFFFAIELLELTGYLLAFAIGVAHWNGVWSRSLWEAVVELILRFAIVGLVLSAYLYLRSVSSRRGLPWESALLTARAAQSACLATVGFYAATSEKVVRTARLSQTLPGWLVCAAAVGAVISGVFLRSQILPRVTEKLRSDPQNVSALSKWKNITIVSMVVAMTVGLLGFILRITGASRAVEWWFFSVSVALLLLWRPDLNRVTRSMPQ